MFLRINYSCFDSVCFCGEYLIKSFSLFPRKPKEIKWYERTKDLSKGVKKLDERCPICKYGMNRKDGTFC